MNNGIKIGMRCPLCNSRQATKIIGVQAFVVHKNGCEMLTVVGATTYQSVHNDKWEALVKIIEAGRKALAEAESINGVK